MASPEIQIRTPVPATKAIKDVIEGMLGREIKLAHGSPVVPRVGTPATVAIYVNRAKVVRAVVVVDLALSAHLSAAIGLFAPELAIKAIEEEQLDSNCIENLSEVLNVLTTSLNAPGAPTISLDKVVPLGGYLSSDAAILLRTLGSRLDQEIAIQGYGSGSISIVCI